MQETTPEILLDVGLDFSWDLEKVWALDLPVRELDMNQLVWHLDLPLLNYSKRGYDLHPYEVVYDPHRHNEEYQKTLNANLKHPIHVMEKNGRWIILDGIHRLMKSYLVNLDKVRVRIVPSSLIQQIQK